MLESEQSEKFSILRKTNSNLAPINFSRNLPLGGARARFWKNRRYNIEKSNKIGRREDKKARNGVSTKIHIRFFTTHYFDGVHISFQLLIHFSGEIFKTFLIIELIILLKVFIKSYMINQVLMLCLYTYIIYFPDDTDSILCSCSPVRRSGRTEFKIRNLEEKRFF